MRATHARPASAKTNPQTQQVGLVAVLLVLAIWAVFGQTARFGFVNYDDNKYIYENPIVQRGLSWQGVRWALTYSEIGHWHPLTWLTHMADCQFFGLWAGGHHLTNVALHAITSILLFLVWREMTGSLGRSAFVAAVFAIHPLRAESVAWIAERKDVLSGMFFMLTLLAYLHYTRQPSWGRYAGMAALFALGLLSKNMLVTLPFVLLLLDWWPLGRIQRRQGESPKPGAHGSPVPFWKLWMEKIPLFVLSIGSCVATALVSEKHPDAERVAFVPRLGNAVVSYIIYLRQLVFPAGLANPYPYPPSGPPLWEVCGAAVMLALLTAGAVALRQKRPFLLLGWLWYLGMLVPVIGLVQISYYSHADRYTYLPEIGLAVALTWAVADLSARWPHRRLILGSLTAAVLGALGFCGHLQTSYWRDGEPLWTHTLACTSSNFVAHLDLGELLRFRGKLNEAAVQYRDALAIAPTNVETLNDLGNVLAMSGQDQAALAEYHQALAAQPNFADTHVNLGNLLLHVNIDEAIGEYQKALAIAPASADILNNLGKALAAKGDDAAAVAQYEKALEIQPGYANARYNLGNRFLKMGRFEDAAAQYRKFLELQPEDTAARNLLGKALLLKGDFDGAMFCFQTTTSLGPDPLTRWLNLGRSFLEQKDWKPAMGCYRQALKISPRSTDALVNLGAALFQDGNAKDAIISWQDALALNPDPINGNPILLQMLAEAFAQAGNYGRATDAARRALELAVAQNNAALAAELQKELMLYRLKAAPASAPP